MPDGVTHFQLGLVAGAALTAATALYAPADLRAVAIGTAIGLLVTPDLDQEGKTFTEAVLRRIPGLGFLFQVSWYPYALLFRHRGWSHHIIVGTLSRVLWTGCLLVFWATVAIGAGWLWDGAPRDWVELVARPLVQHATVTIGDAPGVLLGWWLQDALHIIADTL